MMPERLMSKNKIWPRVALILLLLLPVPAAMAADDEQAGPWYDVPAMPHKTPWVTWVIAAAFCAGAVGMALKNPHRSHLD
jgi:hypothetical protein